MSRHSGKQSRLAAEEILRFAQNDERGTRLLGIILTILLAISMIPAVGLRSAFADEPVERPATTSGDAALEGYAAETTPVASQREDGMYVADGLVYTVADGGLSLVGFDGLPEGEDVAKEVVVPEAVSVDGKDATVVAVAIVEGNIVESIVSLTLPQSINNVDTSTLAAAFPNLASVEVVSPKVSAPVVAGAAAMKAAYSSFGGILYKNVRGASEGDASQTTLTKELVWASPATVVARIPAECTSIASGAFTDVKDLKTVVCFGVMESIAQAQKADDGTITPGAFTDEQIQTVNVIVPQTGTVVSDSDRVSASVAVTDDSTMDIKRETWWKSGFASDRITLGEVYGSTTNALPVTEEGVLETAEAEVAYAPETTQNSSSRKAGIEPPESAIPTPVPDDDSADSSESGLVFTHLADMTLSVSWKGDPTATPSHLDIPAYATINGVAYPVTEIVPNAFEGAIFLTSVTISEGITAIGKSAFTNCANLADANFPSTLKSVAANAFDGTAIPVSALPAAVLSQSTVLAADVGSNEPQSISALMAAEPESGAAAFAPNVSTDSAAPASGTLADTEGKEAAIGDGMLTLSGDSISSYAAADSSLSLTDVRIFCSADCIASASPSDRWSLSSYNSRNQYYTLTVTSGKISRLSLSTVDRSTRKLTFTGAAGAASGGVLEIMLKSGFNFLSYSIDVDASRYSLFLSVIGTSSGSVADGDHSHSDYLTKSSNLSDLTNASMARSNLGLGTLATKSSLAASDIPSLAASKITSGTFSTSLIPSITSSKIEDGTIVNADISASAAIAASKISGLGNAATKNTGTGANDVAAGNHTHGTAYVGTSAQALTDANKTQALKNLGLKDASGNNLYASYATQQKVMSGDASNDTLKQRLDDLAGTGSGSVASQIEGAFGTITYEPGCLDGDVSHASFPTAYRKGGTPAIPAPKRDGWEFVGWKYKTSSDSWADLDAGAFSGDSVELKAEWKETTKGQNCFFPTGALDYENPNGAAGAWTSTIAVRVTTDTNKNSVTGLKFEENDLTGLLKRGSDGSLPDVTFAVGTSSDNVSGAYKFGAAAGDCQLVDMDGGKGIWVRITIPANSIDTNRVVGSMTAEDYVASIARMTFTSIA